ncbi:hypothetical protein B0H14DRAFT_3588132 [Mycena olivaceomarginata]|nr:hypothetical protein B0H14DRAFT_3588132 [Mycena olivaceomarginata]
MSAAPRLSPFSFLLPVALTYCPPELSQSSAPSTNHSSLGTRSLLPPWAILSPISGSTTKMFHLPQMLAQGRSRPKETRSTKLKAPKISSSASNWDCLVADFTSFSQDSKTRERNPLLSGLDAAQILHRFSAPPPHWKLGRDDGAWTSFHPVHKLVHLLVAAALELEDFPENHWFVVLHYASGVMIYLKMGRYQHFGDKTNLQHPADKTCCTRGLWYHYYPLARRSEAEKRTSYAVHRRLGDIRFVLVYYGGDLIANGGFPPILWLVMSGRASTSISFCFLFAPSLVGKTAGTKLLMVASCMMAVVGSTQMAVDVAIAVAAARLLQQLVHSEVVNEQGLIILPLFELTLPALETGQAVTFTINKFHFRWLYRCYVIWGHKKAIILPALLMLSTFVAVVGIVACVNDVTDTRIPLILGAATNLVLTALTVLSGRPAGRIFWIRRAASHVALGSTFRSRYNRAIGLIVESGAVYCIVAMFLVISSSLNREIFSIGVGIGQQLMNIIPTFTLVYVGRNNTGDNTSAESSCRMPSNQRPPPR